MIASHRFTGAAEPTAQSAVAESREGAQVLLALTPGGSFEERAGEMGVTTTGAVSFNRAHLPWNKRRDLKSLRGLIADFRPDIVHSHLTHDHLLAAVAIGRPGPKNPILFRTFHRQENLRHPVLFRHFLTKRTHGAVAISEEIRDQLVSRYGFERERVFRANCAVDTTRFSPAKGHGERFREKWGIPQDAPVAGIISRIRVARGHEWLLKALEKTLPRIPEAYFVICGRGSWKKELLARLEKLPFRSRIIYAGYVSGEDLENAYRSFDVSLLLRPGNDGASRAALESMSCGTPVITGRVDVISEIIRRNGAGWIVPDNDVQGLAEALRAALSSREQCRQLGEIARQDMLEHHDERSLAAPTLDFYQQIINSSPFNTLQQEGELEQSPENALPHG